MRSYGRRGRDVIRWQFGKGERVLGRKGRVEFKDKIVLYCSREEKCMQRFDNDYVKVWTITIKWASVA